jgi:hypothetical protein
MTITHDEIAELLDDVTATIGQILVQHSALREDMLGRDTETAKSKVEALRLRLDTERVRLRKHKDAEKRKKELEKMRTVEEGSFSTRPMTPIKNGNGVLIGWIKRVAGGRFEIYNGQGRIIARIG